MKKTELYLSNCLIEALKAKLKDWENVSVKTYLPSFAGSLHFGWSDGKNDWEFLPDTSLPWWKACTLYKGRKIRRRHGFHDRLITVQKKENLGRG